MTLGLGPVKNFAVPNREAAPLSWPQSLTRLNSDTARRIAAGDWSRTPLGSIEKWPSSLRTALTGALESSFPTLILWGPDLFHFYNDPTKPLLGNKAEGMDLGTPAREVYPELWHILQPLLLQVLQEAKAVFVQEQLLPINRYGFTEEAYFTFSYSPIRDEKGDVGGVICTVIETTPQVVNERRIRILHEMALNLSGINTVEGACRRCLETLSRNRQDMPFCVLRMLRSEDGVAKVMGSFGVEVQDRRLGDLPANSYYPALEEVVLTKMPVFVPKVPSDVKIQEDMFGRELPRSIYVMPFFLSGSDEVDGFLSVGLNPGRPFDADYKEFLHSLATQIGIAISGAKAQEKSMRQLGSLIDASPDHVFLLDHEGRYVFLNLASRAALMKHLESKGRSHEDPLNQSGRDMEFEPEFLERFESEQRRAFRGETIIGEVRFPSPRGGLREYEYILSPMRDEFGIVTHIAGITRDVQDLKNAITVRDQFLSVASHELKTPISSLKLHVQMRARQLNKGLVEKFTPEFLAKMFSDDERQINRLTRLVDDMLDIARLNSGKFSHHPEEFEIKALILEVVDRYRTQAGFDNQSIEVYGDDVRGKWDRYRIEQVIINLLSNAMKYGAQKPISISVKSVGQFVRLKFKDQGIGIHEEDQHRIFQQFERAVSANEVSGLGLGLYIVKQIVIAHGGLIHVSSQLGHGSEFVVELPLVTPG